MLIASHGFKGQGIEVEQSQVGEYEKTAEVERGKGSVQQGVDSGVSVFGFHLSSPLPQDGQNRNSDSTGWPQWGHVRPGDTGR